MEKSTVSQLLNSWLIEKELERAANSRRVGIELELLESGFFEQVSDGSKSSRLDDYKVTIKNGYSYKLDLEKWEEVKDMIPESISPVKVKYSVNPSAAKVLQSTHKEIWLRAAHAITQKPSKPGFSVEVVAC